jgi:hypothetical protein
LIRRLVLEGYKCPFNGHYILDEVSKKGDIDGLRSYSQYVNICLFLVYLFAARSFCLVKLLEHCP